MESQVRGKVCINKWGSSLQYWTSTLFLRSMLTAQGHWLSPQGPNCPGAYVNPEFPQTRIGSTWPSRRAEAVRGPTVRRVWKCHCQRSKVCIYEGYTFPTTCNRVKNWWIGGLLPVTTLVAVHCWIVLPQPRTTELRCDCRGTLESTTKAHVTLTLPS